MQNHVQKNMEHGMETGLYRGLSFLMCAPIESEESLQVAVYDTHIQIVSDCVLGLRQKVVLVMRPQR